MKRPINIRLSLVCVLSGVLGIFSFYKCLFGNYLYLIISVLLISAVAVVAIVCKTRYWVFCIVAAAFLFIGFADTFSEYQIRNESDIAVESGVLCGRITDIGRNGESENVIYAEDCTFNGRKLFGRVKIDVYDGTEFSMGDIVSVNGTLRQAYAFTSKMTTSDCVKYRVRYVLTDTSYWSVNSGALKLDETARKFVYDIVSQYMPSNSDVAYALLTGDRNAMDENKTNSFIEAGIIHLLVVSGLHVGFVVGIFGFILKKLKLPVWAEFSLMLIPMFFYAYLCDFAPSVMRASVMTSVVYISKMLHGKYDLLTSLCWAALFILVAQPLYLFDVGFQLSVMSVFGIATLFLQTERVFARRKIPKAARRLVSSLCMSFSCVASAFFVSAYTFKSAVLLGIIVNIVAIPLVFAAFVLLAVGMLPWLFHEALWLADLILQIVTDLAEFTQSAHVVLVIRTSAWAIPVCGILLFILGGYVNLSKVKKAASCAVCFVLLVVFVLSASLPHNCANTVAVFVGYEQSVIVATADDNSAVVLGGFNDFATDRACEYLTDKKIQSLCLFITDTKDVDCTYVSEFCDVFNVVKVYKMDSSGNTLLEYYLQEEQIPFVQMQYNNKIGSSVTVQSVYNGGLAGAVVKVGNIGVATVLGGTVKTKYFAEMRKDVNVYCVSCAQGYYSEQGLVTISRYQEPVSGNFGANKYGNFTIVEKHGTIKLNFGT